MPLPTIVFRTSDPRWGLGAGANLQAVNVDENFYNVDQRLIILEANYDAAVVSIDDFTVDGSEMTVEMTDGTTRGPFELPVIVPRFLGAWQASFAYIAGDIITANGVTYVVRITHTSDTTFDPGATNGSGDDLYGVLLELPEATLPTGGAANHVLAKVDGTNYNVYWADLSSTISLSLLQDVVLTSILDGQVLVWSASDEVWYNLSLTLNGLADVSRPVDGHLQVPRWSVVDQQYNVEWPRQIVTVSSTSVTTESGHLEKYVRCTHVSGCLVTVAEDSNFTAGTLDDDDGVEIHFRAAGGPLTFLPASGSVVLNGVDGFQLATDRQGAVVTLKHVGLNTWDVFGLLAASPGS